MMPNNMSRDRVVFGIRLENLSEIAPKYRGLLERTLGIRAHLADGLLKEAEARHDERVWIKCRPSQFARFLIERNRIGLKNGFRELYPELIPPTKEDVAHDVSRNSSNYWYDRERYEAESD